MQLFNMKYRRADTAPAKDIFSWRSRVEDGNLPLSCSGCSGEFGRQGTNSKMQAAPCLPGKYLSGPDSRDKQSGRTDHVSVSRTYSCSFLHSIPWYSRKSLLLLISHVKSRGMFFADSKTRCQEICWAPRQVCPVAGYSKVAGLWYKEIYLAAEDTESNSLGLGPAH